MKKIKKEKIRLSLYEDKIKSMTKKEIIKQIREEYDLKSVYDGDVSGLLALVGGGGYAVAAVLFGISDSSVTCAIYSILAGCAISLGIGVSVNDSKKTNEINNRLDILFNYVDSDEVEKEKDSTKTINSLR